MSEKNARLHCISCKGTTNHIKLSAPIGQAKFFSRINQRLLGGNKIIEGVATTYGAVQGLLFEIGNGVSRKFLGKSAVTYWMCETCELVHERYLED
jgi:nitrate/nitrite transporter NarK